jgi:GH18 family chitinase
LMKALTTICALAGLSAGRVAEGTVSDDAPLVVIYYENWAGWVRGFGPSTIDQNILSRDMPVRNFVLNYSFWSWNPEECSIQPVDTVDLCKEDPMGWTESDWNLDAQESWETSKAAGGILPAFMMLKAKYPYIKLMPSIGGWSRSGTYHDCLINKPDVMLQSVIDFVTVYGWDGVDFDWEYPNCDGAPCGCQGEAVCLPETGLSNKGGAGDWDRYKDFTTQLRAKFNELEDQLGRRLYMTAALGMNPKIIDGNNDVWSTPMPVEFFCDEDVFDWVNLMTYDFFGPWAAITGPLAPLYPNPSAPSDQMSIQESVEKILARCSKPYKLTMGLATYGKSWQGVPKTGDVPGLWQSSTASTYPAGGTWELGTLSWFDLLHNVVPACTRTWDDVSKTPTLYCDTMPSGGSIPYDTATGPVDRTQQNVFITYEDAESWKYKMEWAKSKGMAGAIIWAASDVGSGESWGPDSTAELFAGLFEGWNGSPVTIGASKPNSYSFSPITKWASFPCPLVPNLYIATDKPIDVSRCAGQTYPTSGTYLKATGSGTQSQIGQNKLMIHPVSGGTTPTTPAPVVATTTPYQPPVVATTTPYQPIPNTTPAPSVITTTPYQPPVTTPAPAVVTTTPVPAPVPTTTPASGNGGGDAVSGCQSKLTSDSQWIDTCKGYCASYGPGGALALWCPGASTADALAQCVIGQQTFCRLG